MKLIEKKRAEAVKAQNNIVKAIEQGIITETTKSRLTELENLISQYDVEIIKEKARSYTYLTADDIEMYLSKFVFDNTDDIKVRKLLVNAFIREVILYDDKIVITYNFTDSPEHLKLTKEHVTKTEKEIETADKTAISSNTGSYKLCHTAPRIKYRYFLVSVFFLLSYRFKPARSKVIKKSLYYAAPIFFARLYSDGGILRFAPWRSRTLCARLKADALVSGASE